MTARLGFRFRFRDDDDPSFAARAHWNASRPLVPHPTTSTAAGVSGVSLATHRETASASRAIFATTVGWVKPGCAGESRALSSSAWSSAHISASQAANAPRTPFAPRDSMSRAWGETRSVTGTRETSATGGIWTPPRARARRSASGSRKSCCSLRKAFHGHHSPLRHRSEEPVRTAALNIVPITPSRHHPTTRRPALFSANCLLPFPTLAPRARPISQDRARRTSTLA